MRSVKENAFARQQGASLCQRAVKLLWLCVFCVTSVRTPVATTGYTNDRLLRSRRRVRIDRDRRELFRRRKIVVVRAAADQRGDFGHERRGLLAMPAATSPPRAPKRVEKRPQAAAGASDVRPGCPVVERCGTRKRPDVAAFREFTSRPPNPFACGLSIRSCRVRRPFRKTLEPREVEPNQGERRCA